MTTSDLAAVTTTSGSLDNHQPNHNLAHDTNSLNNNNGSSSHAVNPSLKFSDVPGETSQLSYAPSRSSGTSGHSNDSSLYPPTTATTTGTTATTATATTTHTTSNNTSNAGSLLTTSDASLKLHRDLSRSRSHDSFHAITPLARAPALPHEAPASSIRKTSPGLAARLKALGFGSSRTTSSPATPLDQNIGRLDSSQLRKLDENHQASSNFVVSRRGRPWKGAGANPFSRSSREPVAVAHSLVPADSPQLPEIRTPEPLAMDTQKYRLPDHTNGNGTKATLDTRREHLERSMRRLSIDEVGTPPPPPPPKDTPPLPPSQQPSAVADTVPNFAAEAPSTDYVPGLSSYFTPGHNRPGSIYTLSRASFANQLAQLTSLQLPDADSLASKISAIPTAHTAAKALTNAADQIRSWISKAQEVIGGLDSEDDVEWAAAGGREGLEEVENAIVRFEELINAYVGSIEELQGRNDVSAVATDDLKRAVSQMEIIVEEWAKIRATLQTVRVQVEIAMEWEELWNNVLGDIQDEMDELIRLVFEMEERRHKSIVAAASGESVDIGDLETIVEEKPAHVSRLQAPNRFSMPALPLSPSTPGTPSLSQDDSSLLALFARMQPLRASLDFLPMRLSVFENRAQHAFPTACEELEMRREGLDANYKKLEKDAESLRKELGEDRWVIVFRGAGRQAQKMHESVERSLLKLQEAVDSEMHLTNQPTMAKKIESYEAKKTHYGPAIERVLSIIDRGVQDRLTVNGEILRLHAEMQFRWASLKQHIKEMDAVLEEVQADRKNQQLRDSISSLLSNDVSTAGSGRETPGSSPPSSVIMASLGFDPHTPVSKHAKARSPMSNSASTSKGRRHSSLPAPTSQVTSRKQSSRLSTIASSSLSTPVPASKIQRPSSTLAHRPPWNYSTNSSTLDSSNSFKTSPSPYPKRSPITQRSVSALTPASAGSKLPSFRTSIARATSESPSDTPSRGGHSRMSFRERLASPQPPTQQSSRLTTKTSMSALTNRRASMQPSASNSTVDESQNSRPASSMASSRRSSLLPQPRAGSAAGRASPQLTTGGRFAARKNSTNQVVDTRPRWRH